MRNFMCRILSAVTAAVCLPALFACGKAPSQTDTEADVATISESYSVSDKDTSALPFVQTVTDAAAETSLVTDIQTEAEPETETGFLTETETEITADTETETDAPAVSDTAPEYTTGTEAAVARETSSILADITVTYGKYKDKANDRIPVLFDELRFIDADTADKWERIMDIWKKYDNDTVVNYGVLPDGLCDTDELCIVVLGFQLNPDGTMKDELINRLKTALACAEKYPCSYIVCTGGGTASNDPSATEASAMAKWLTENGINKDRIITEERSTSTAKNAVFTLEILYGEYQNISQIAVVSSDYHVLSGALTFEAELILNADKYGNKKYTVVSNAACAAPGRTLSETYTPSSLIELTGEIELSKAIYYDEYVIS